MGLQRELSVAAMRATPFPGSENFLEKLGIATPIPAVPGSIGVAAHEPFMAKDILRLFDVLVAFTIGDFPRSMPCSNYFNPHSPWYNVFYGAYGIRSYKPDGSPWGFHPDGTANPGEMMEVPLLDYNFLTAGALGCPPEKLCFRPERVENSTQGSWQVMDVHAVIPSGLHHKKDAVSPDLKAYVLFGTPEESLMVGGRQSYEPVRMFGRMRYKPVAPRLTLAWGGLCPDTAEGRTLLGTILGAMEPLYAR
jgi:hypothetical protein